MSKEIFCGLLSDAYRDSYVRSSTDYEDLEEKYMDLGWDQFKRKKKQIKELNEGRLFQLHFGCDGKTTDSIVRHEQLFEEMKDCLLPHGIILNGLQLKRAYFAWTWLLKDGVYVPRQIQNQLISLKAKIDNRPLSQSEKKHISVQSIAQVVPYVNGYFDILGMKKYIAKLHPIAPTILCLNLWKSVRDYQKNREGESSSNEKDLMRDIEKLIAPMRPGKKRSKEIPLYEIKLIPGIVEGGSVKTIHFPKFFWALTCIVFMLVACGLNYDQISCHPIIQRYLQELPHLFHDLIKQHIQGTYRNSVAFFD